MGTGARLELPFAGDAEHAVAVASDKAGTGIAHSRPYSFRVICRHVDGKFIELLRMNRHEAANVRQADGFSQNIVYAAGSTVPVRMRAVDGNVMAQELLEKLAVVTVCTQVGQLRENNRVVADDQVVALFGRKGSCFLGYVQGHQGAADFLLRAAYEKARVIPFFCQIGRREGFHDLDYFAELY